MLGMAAASGAAVPIAPPDPDHFIPGRFTGKTIIITGCARGMGAGVALRAAREGANVVGVDWLEDLGAKTIEDIVASGGAATFVPGDIGTTEACDRMVKVAVDTFGGVDLAVNNAGMMDGVSSRRSTRRPTTIGTGCSEPTPAASSAACAPS